MQDNAANGNHTWVGKFNLAVLLFVIAFVAFYPVHKKIWYDEAVSIICSKGLYYTDGNELTALKANSSEVLQTRNAAGNVYHCTLIDNGNSFIYNECLHFYTNIFGNSINSYMALSQWCAIGVLIMLFLFCRMLWGDSFYTSLALVLVCTDSVFWGMAHEIRAYSMGMLFTVTAAFFCYRNMYKGGKTIDLLLFSTLSLAAILTHYLSVYAVLVLAGYVLVVRNKALLQPRNIAAILIPILLLGLYFVLAASGFAAMSNQNARIAARSGAAEAFSLSHVVSLALKFTDGNFKFTEPVFNGSFAVVAMAALLIAILYVAAVRLSVSVNDKRHLHLLFLLGISGSVFLSALCLKSHHYTALYFRYFSFCIPFSILFTVYALYVIGKSHAVKKSLSVAITCFVMLPPLALFSIIFRGGYKFKHTHNEIAFNASKNGYDKVIVKEWMDAFLIQSFMPDGKSLNYIVDSTVKEFLLVKGDSVLKVPCEKINP